MLRLIRSISTLFIALVVAATSSTLASAVERSTYLVMPNPGAVSEVRSLISSLGEYPEEQLQLLDDLFVVDLLPEAAQSLAASSAVAYIEQDSPVSLTAVQEPAPSWGQDRIDGALDGKYNFPSQSGEGVIAYVFDTGVAADHPDLAGRVSQGFDVIGNNQANTDCHFHGTHVAGTIGGTQFGLAKKVSIVPLRVLDCNGSGSIVGVMRAINWTIANHPTGTPAVANFSLGGGRNLSFNNAISALVDKGITTVVAAGNERTDACTRSPASALDAITVGSTDRFDNRSSFSNFGECVDVFAPGSGILSANAKNYTTPIALSGTSMASPHVAGVAALILGTSPSALPEQVASVITDLSQKGIVNGSNTIVGNRLANVPSESAVPIPSLPGAPTGLQVVNSGKGFVSFGWDAVAGAASYQVEYRKASQNTALISSVNTTSFTVTGLSGGEVAYLRVRAVVDGSTTRFSSIVSGRSVVEIASEPREVQVSALSKNSAIISWSLPSYLGGASTLTYRVEMKTTGEWMPIGSGPSSNVQLSNMNVPHQFRVFAVNEAGVSAPSAIATFDPTLVYQVQTMSAIIQGGSNLDLSWLSDAPAGTKFEVSLSQLYRSNTTQTVIVEGNQHRFTGLIRMTAYRVQVTPIGSIRGVGLTQQLVTSAVTPSAPRFISTVRTDAGWQLRFSAPTDNGGVPVVTHRLEALVDGQWSQVQSSLNLNFDVPSPAKGKSQDYRLIAVNSIGDSLPSAVARVSTPASVASAPFSLSGSVLADGRVQLSWSTPLDDGGAPVVGYRIEALRSGVWTFATSTRDLTSSGFVIAKGTSVSYRVLAQNSAGLSVPSNAIDLVREATAPGEVRNFSAAISSGIIRLTWGAPNDDGGTPILGYRVEQRIGQQWTVLLDQTQSLSHEVAAGSPGAVSAYRVFAITRVGVSATASERTVQVPFLQASEPLSFSAVLEGNRIRFAWNAPVQLGGSTLSGYVIASAVSGSPFRSIANLPAGATSLVWAGANPGTEIQFRIAAATIGAGTGAWSLPILLRIPAVAPSDPNALTAQVRAGEGVLLTWTAPSSDGGSPILDYRVEVRRSTGWALLGRTAGLSYLAPLGVAGEILQHRVVAINAIGSSPGIRSISSQMGIAPATAPQSLSAAISSSRLVLTWSAPDIMGGTFNFYEIQVLDAGVFRRLATAGGTSITTALPAPGASVSFRVVAVTNAGVGAFTDALVFTSPKQVPGQPSAFTMSSNGKNVTFNWRVGSSGGGTLANAILYREVSGSWVEVMRAPAQAGTATFANELFGQLARYSLRISNEVGESSGSTTFSLRHAVIATSKPLAMSLTRQVNGLLLSWQNPEANGGAQPSQAEIQSSVDGQTWTRVALIRWSNSALVALPQKGRAVSYRVVAINPAGPSEPSDAVRFENPLTAPMGNIVVSAARSGNSVLFRVTAPADFGGYSEASLSIERTGSLAFIASGETRLTRPLGSVTVTLPLPSARGTYTYRILITNPSGVLEQTVTFTF